LAQATASSCAPAPMALDGDVLVLAALAHRGALLRIIQATGCHHEGLHQGAAKLRGRLSTRMLRRLRDLEAVYGFARHVSRLSVDSFLLELDRELADGPAAKDAAAKDDDKGAEDKRFSGETDAQLTVQEHECEGEDHVGKHRELRPARDGAVESVLAPAEASAGADDDSGTNESYTKGIAPAGRDLGECRVAGRRTGSPSLTAPAAGCRPRRPKQRGHRPRGSSPSAPGAPTRTEEGAGQRSQNDPDSLQRTDSPRASDSTSQMLLSADWDTIACALQMAARDHRYAEIDLIIRTLDTYRPAWAAAARAIKNKGRKKGPATERALPG